MYPLITTVHGYPGDRTPAMRRLLHEWYLLDVEGWGRLLIGRGWRTGRTKAKSEEECSGEEDLIVWFDSSEQEELVREKHMRGYNQMTRALESACRISEHISHAQVYPWEWGLQGSVCYEVEMTKKSPTGRSPQTAGGRPEPLWEYKGIRATPHGRMRGTAEGNIQLTWRTQNMHG